MSYDPGMREKLGIGVSTTCLVVLVSAATASAQRAPDTATMDRGDGITRLGLDFGLSFLDKPFAPYDAALRIEPYGQYVTDTGYGFYGAVPFARSFGGGVAPEPEEATAIGNLELGGLFVRAGETTSWVFRGGVALPTAGDSLDSVLTNRSATFPRLTDLALTAPEAFYVRLSVSPLLHMNHFFLQADLGFDLGIGTSDGADPDHLLRLNLGGGYDFGLLALGLELVNLAAFDDVDNNEQFVHTLAFTMRFMGERLQPVITIGTTLDDSLRDQLTLFIATGIQAVFR
jgi:hypothetical protein